jgi:hypothetical protein
LFPDQTPPLSLGSLFTSLLGVARWQLLANGHLASERHEGCGAIPPPRTTTWTDVRIAAMTIQMKLRERFSEFRSGTVPRGVSLRQSMLAAALLSLQKFNESSPQSPSQTFDTTRRMVFTNPPFFQTPKEPYRDANTASPTAFTAFTNSG